MNVYQSHADKSKVGNGIRNLASIGRCSAREASRTRVRVRKSPSDSFEEVSLGKGQCERIFHISAPDRLSYRFFQSKRIYNVNDDQAEFSQLRDDARKALKTLFMPNVFADEEDFYIALPLAEKPSLKIDEFIAGYLIFFYLGSLVRYHPDYLERILRSREAWVIRRFTASCATTLLRHASIFLLGENRVLGTR
jgi:hypothetical protein